jgi:hypothetical protein
LGNQKERLGLVIRGVYYNKKRSVKKGNDTARSSPNRSFRWRSPTSRGWLKGVEDRDVEVSCSLEKKRVFPPSCDRISGSAIREPWEDMPVSPH